MLLFEDADEVVVFCDDDEEFSGVAVLFNLESLVKVASFTLLSISAEMF